MQRISGGLKVPKLMMDMFRGESSNAAGNVTLELTYVPKSVYDIIIPLAWSSTLLTYVIVDPASLAGKTLTAVVYKHMYHKADTPTGAQNSGGAGADPHSHALAYTSTIVATEIALSVALGTVRVHYEVG